MQRVDTPTAAATPPTQDPLGTPGYFTKGNPVSGTLATVPAQDFLNAVQEELVGTILAAGLTLSKTDSTQLLQAIKTIAVPTGRVDMFAGASTPLGYLLCNGAAISRTTFAALFTAIGTVWGAGDGTTTFNVPDLRGRAPVGAGQGTGLTNRALAANGGAETVALTAANNGPHTHSIVDPGHFHGANAYFNNGFGPGLNAALDPNAPGYNTLSSVTGVTVASSGSGTAHDNMQPFAAVNFIIKT